MRAIAEAIAGIAIAAFAFLAPLGPQATTGAAADEIITRTVAYTSDGQAKGFLAYPAKAAGAPAIILIHEWWGLNDQIRSMAKRFADAGCVALAVDLYDGKSTTKRDTARALATAVRKDMDRAFANLRAAVDHLSALENGKVDTARLASIGWCFGGGWSYQMAKNALGTKVSVIYYGFFNPADDLTKMRARIIGHFGENDRAIKVDTVRAFQANLKTAGGGHEVYIYPNSDHAFANESGGRYNKQAAELAWQRTMAFLGKHL